MCNHKPGALMARIEPEDMVLGRLGSEVCIVLSCGVELPKLLLAQYERRSDRFHWQLCLFAASEMSVRCLDESAFKPIEVVP
jgi:hypothetical protein